MVLHIAQFATTIFSYSDAKDHHCKQRTANKTYSDFEKPSSKKPCQRDTMEVLVAFTVSATIKMSHPKQKKKKEN